ncbi:MAG: GDSL-type esterase/lipase family protein [Bacteroidia bacterium]
MQKRRLIKYSVTFLLVIIFIGLFYFSGKKIKQRWIIERTINSTHWQQRSKEIQSIKPFKYKAIFLGNSLTELFDLNYYFKDSTLLNCGIVGDFSEGLLKRLDAIVKLKPEKIFIEIGINDIIEKIPLDEICSNYEQLITKIQKESPDTRIYIQSNLPVIINRPSFLSDNKDVNDLILLQNKNLQIIAQKYKATYIDIYSSFVKEKNLGDLFIWDGIHLTPKGYKIWRDKILSYLTDLKK